MLPLLFLLMALAAIWYLLRNTFPSLSFSGSARGLEIRTKEPVKALRAGEPVQGLTYTLNFPEAGPPFIVVKASGSEGVKLLELLVEEFSLEEFTCPDCGSPMKFKAGLWNCTGCNRVEEDWNGMPVYMRVMLRKFLRESMKWELR